MSTRTEEPEGDDFKTVTELDDATTPTSAAEDDYKPVVMVDEGEYQEIKRVSWSAQQKLMIIEI